MKSWLNIVQHIKCMATLLCEILACKNYTDRKHGSAAASDQAGERIEKNATAVKTRKPS